jgi:hypothetical protein
MTRTTLNSTIDADIHSGVSGGITAATVNSVLKDIAANCLMPEDLAGSGSLASSITSIQLNATLEVDDAVHGGSVLMTPARSGADNPGIWVRGGTTSSYPNLCLQVPNGADSDWVVMTLQGRSQSEHPGDAGFFASIGGNLIFYNLGGTNIVFDSSSGGQCQFKGPLVMQPNYGLQLSDYMIIANPAEGTLAWDFTNHTLVVSDGTYWYPVQLGSAY